MCKKITVHSFFTVHMPWWQHCLLTSTARYQFAYWLMHCSCSMNSALGASLKKKRKKEKKKPTWDLKHGSKPTLNYFILAFYNF